MYALFRHRCIGERKGLSRIGVVLERLDAFAQTGENTLAPLKVDLCGFLEKGESLCLRNGFLFFDPRRIVINDEAYCARVDLCRVSILNALGDFIHVKEVLGRDVFQNGAVTIKSPWHFRGRNLEMRNRHRSHLGRQFVIALGGNRMDGNVVSDRELDLSAIEHVERFHLLVVFGKVLQRALPEYRLPVGRAHNQLRLENPSRITQLFTFLLLVDEKERDKSRPLHRLRHRADDADLPYRIVGVERGYLAFRQLQDLLAAERDALPAFERLSVIPEGRFAVGAIVTAPPRFNLNVWETFINAECQPHRRRHKRIRAQDIISIDNVLGNLLFCDVRGAHFRVAMVNVIGVSVLVLGLCLAVLGHFHPLVLRTLQ